jgi:putative ABC transport system permease protein
MGSGVTLALVGIAIGGAAALALTRVLSNLLYGISATDPISFAAVIALLVVVAMLASWMPARRAARVDPMTVLRES